MIFPSMSMEKVLAGPGDRMTFKLSALLLGLSWSRKFFWIFWMFQTNSAPGCCLDVPAMFQIGCFRSQQIRFTKDNHWEFRMSNPTIGVERAWSSGRDLKTYPDSQSLGHPLFQSGGHGEWEDLPLLEVEVQEELRNAEEMGLFWVETLSAVLLVHWLCCGWISYGDWITMIFSLIRCWSTIGGAFASDFFRYVLLGFPILTCLYQGSIEPSDLVCPELTFWTHQESRSFWNWCCSKEYS